MTNIVGVVDLTDVQVGGPVALTMHCCAL